MSSPSQFVRGRLRIGNADRKLSHLISRALKATESLLEKHILTKQPEKAPSS
jgi:hypothetical protein